MTYTPEIHEMTASQVWQAWKNQELTVGQVEAWQRLNKHYFKEEK